MTDPTPALLEAQTTADKTRTRFRVLREAREEELDPSGDKNLSADGGVLHLLIASESALEEPPFTIDWAEQLKGDQKVPIPGSESSPFYKPYSRGVKETCEPNDRGQTRRQYLHDAGIAESVVANITESQSRDKISVQKFNEQLRPYLKIVRDELVNADGEEKQVYLAGTILHANEIDIIDHTGIHESTVRAPVTTLDDIENGANAITDSLKRAAKGNVASTDPLSR